MAQEQYIKIINQTAKKMLKPYGIIQKGQSRIWIDDNGWFSTIIEFQPFSGRKGTTLNIGANFHWYEEAYFSFDIGHRQDVGFAEYTNNDIDWTKTIEKFCEIAIKKALEYREQLSSIGLAKRTVLEHYFTSEELWGNYHKGTVCGLAGDFDGLNKHYNSLLQTENPHTIKFIDDLKEDVKLLLAKTASKELFQSEIIKIIQETRKLKKLPEMEINFEK